MEFFSNEKVKYKGPDGIGGLNYPKIGTTVTINTFVGRCSCGCNFKMYSLKEYPTAIGGEEQAFTEDVFEKIIN